MAITGFPKAFGVWYKNFERWDVSFFRQISWHWAKECIVPLGKVLRRKKVEVGQVKDITEVPIIEKISFGGIISLTDVDERKGYKGRLFWAYKNDLIYSKIRVKQGSMAIVPDRIEKLAVSAEYPVYSVKSNADTKYLELALRSKPFLGLLDGLAHGGSTKTRIPPEDFERLEIPLPPLEVQRAIVARWQAAQESARQAEEQVYKLESGVPRSVLETLGIPFYENKTLPKVFACSWSSLENWGVGYTSRAISSSKDLHESKFPLKQLGDIARVSYGIQKSPANRPGKNARPYLRVANVQKGGLNLSEIKYIEVADTEMESLRLQRGDLLVCEGNSADLVGRPAIWNDEIPNCVHQNHILKVRVNLSDAIPEFVLEYMQTLPARTYFRGRAKFTTNLASINSNDLRELPVPLPPLEVQHSILERVHASRAEIARQGERAAQIRKDAEAEVETLILGTKKL